MTQNYIAGEDIHFEYEDSKNNKIDKAYVANRDMTVQVELDNSHEAYPVSRVIKQEANGNVVVQEVVDDHKFHSFHRSQRYNEQGEIGEEDEVGEDYNDDEYDYLHSICAYCQNDHRCDHDMQMEEEEEEEEEEYEYEEEEEEEEEDYNEEEDEEDDDEYNDHDCQCPHHHLHYSHHHHHHHSQHYTKHEHNQYDNHHASHRHCKDTSGVPRSSLLEKQKRIIKEQIQRPVSGNFLWDFEFPEDIPDMIEFWIGLPYERKREIANIDFLKELDQIHDHQKPQGSCRLCGNRKSSIEKELEKLYNGYYNVRKLATESLDECDLNIETINTIFFIVEEEKIIEQEESTDALERELLSMADDLVKNNGENFISLIEQLDGEAKDSRISNASSVSTANDENNSDIRKTHGPEINKNDNDLLQKGENILYNDENEHNNEDGDDNVRKDEKNELKEEGNHEEKDGEEILGEEEVEEEEEDEEEDEDYGFESDNASCSSDVSENDYTSRKRLEETYKMLQIFSSKILRKKVHDAFQAKRAEDISRSLLAEEERESKLKKEKEEKEKKKKEKVKEKKRLQRLAKEEERKRLEIEKEESERMIREEQLRKTEEGRKRKEAEKKKREEELKAKQEEKKRRKELELERSRKEKEEKERKKQEAKKQRDEELLKKREEKERKERERQEKKEQEKQLLLKKQMEEEERLEKRLSELKLIQQKNKEADLEKEKQKQAEKSLQESRPLHMGTPTPLPNNSESLGSNGLHSHLFNSDFIPMNQSTLAAPPHHFPGFDSTPLLESHSLLNMKAGASSMYGANTFTNPFGNDSSGSNAHSLLNNNGLTTNVANPLLSEELGFQEQNKGLFNSALFDSKSLSGEGTPKVNEGSIWNSSVTPLNNLGTRETSQPAATAATGRHNSIWSSGEMSGTRTPSFSWSTPVANGADPLATNPHASGVSVSATESLGIPQIELIQLESFKAAGRLPYISSDILSVPLLYHYTRSLLAGKLPSLKLEQFVAALSFDLGSKLQFSFSIFKDDKNEDVVKIVKRSAMLPANGMGGMNLNNLGMDMNYMNSSQLGGLNGGLNVFNGMNNINPLNCSGLENLAMNGNGLNLMNSDAGLLNALNGMGSMHTMNMNPLNMNLAGLNMNTNMNTNMDVGGHMGLGGMHMNMNVNMSGLNPLQDYSNSVGLDSKDPDRLQPAASAAASAVATADGRHSSRSGSVLASSTAATDTWPLF